MEVEDQAGNSRLWKFPEGLPFTFPTGEAACSQVGRQPSHASSWSLLELKQVAKRKQKKLRQQAQWRAREEWGK